MLQCICQCNGIHNKIKNNNNSICIHKQSPNNVDVECPHNATEKNSGKVLEACVVKETNLNLIPPPKGIAFMALLIVPSGIQSPTTLPEDGPFGQFTLDLSCIQSRISDLSLVCLCSSQTLTYCHNKRNACHSQT